VGGNILPLIGEIDQSGRQRGFVGMQQNTYQFICRGCRQTCTSHAWNAHYCPKKSCQAAKAAEENRRHGIKQAARRSKSRLDQDVKEANHGR
jgi:hypothetical protein